MGNCRILQLARLLGLLIILVSAVGSAGATTLGSAFTVQGRLTDSDSPVEGTMTVRVEPYGCATGPDTLAPPFDIDDVQIDDGFFVFPVDFGDGFFVGDEVYLELSVRIGAAKEFTALSPRQRLAPTPHALLATRVGIDAVGSDEIAARAVGASEVDAGEVQLRVRDGCGADQAIAGIDPSGDIACREFWSPGGNGLASIRTFGVDDGQIRIEVGAGGLSRSAATYELGSSTSTSVQGAPLVAVNAAVGINHNVSSSAVGATVAGGANHRVANSAGYAVIGGGYVNEVGGGGAVVAGGASNLATGDFSAVAGGQQNEARGASAAVAGGEDNLATGDHAFVAGGLRNFAAGNASFAGGDSAFAGGTQTFVWAGGDGIGTTVDGAFIVEAPGGFGINEADPRAVLHVTDRNLFLSPDDVVGDDVLIEDIDAVAGIYSSPAQFFGSAVVLGETTTGGLVDKWAMVRETTQGSGDSDLNFTFGTDENYGQNPPQVTFTESGGAFKADGSTTWNTNSDARIKREVRPVLGASEKIGALRPVAYRFTQAYLAEHPELADEERLSFLAQEYREVFPHAVHERDEPVPGHKSREQGGENQLQIDIHPALITTIAAMQELMARLDAQDARIRELEALLGQETPQ
ncbi:MAG: tail fiber domain-containing protein [Pseudomonadota bacterium]